MNFSVSVNFLLFTRVKCWQPALLYKVKFVDIACCANNVSEIHGFSFLLLGDLTAHSSQILHKQLSCLSDKNKSLLAHECVVLLVKLAYLSNSIHWQLHELPYNLF